MGPGVPAVGGPVNVVDIVVRKPAAAFVHTRDVDGPVAGHVASDLGIANESAGVAQLFAGPSLTVISGEGDLEGAAANSEVVPGNVHPPKEGRGRVVVGPARLAVVRAAVVNASTSRPGDPAVSGLPGADALSAAARSQKNSKESAGRFVVESNRVAKVRPVSSCERAWIEAGEGRAAVAGDTTRQSRLAGAVRESL